MAQPQHSDFWPVLGRETTYFLLQRHQYQELSVWFVLSCRRLWKIQLFILLMHSSSHLTGLRAEETQWGGDWKIIHTFYSNDNDRYSGQWVGSGFPWFLRKTPPHFSGGPHRHPSVLSQGQWPPLHHPICVMNICSWSGLTGNHTPTCFCVSALCFVAVSIWNGLNEDN